MPNFKAKFCLPKTISSEAINFVKVSRKNIKIGSISLSYNSQQLPLIRFLLDKIFQKLWQNFQQISPWCFSKAKQGQKNGKRIMRNAVNSISEYWYLKYRDSNSRNPCRNSFLGWFPNSYESFHEIQFLIST